MCVRELATAVFFLATVRYDAARSLSAGNVETRSADPTDEQESQQSECLGASVLQEAPHLRPMSPAQDGARHNSMREMQPVAREVTEGANPPELRARRCGGRLRALPQASRECDQQAMPEVPSQPCRAQATQQKTRCRSSGRPSGSTRIVIVSP